MKYFETLPIFHSQFKGCHNLRPGKALLVPDLFFYFLQYVPTGIYRITGKTELVGQIEGHILLFSDCRDFVTHAVHLCQLTF